MSRYRNRNIRSKFRSTSPPKETADSGFGDLSKGYKKSNHWSGLSSFSSYGSSDIEIIEDDDKKDGLRSSGSSISWAEDYELHEQQSTELVQKEYDRMERVLQCVEPIPANYDRDEYKLWIKTFPFLSLTGQSSSAKSHKIFTSLNEEKLKPACDKTTSAAQRPQTRTVIDKLLEELYPHSSSTTYSNKSLALNTTLNPRTLDIEFDSFLQITPVTLPKNPSWLDDFKTPSARKKSDFIVLPPIDVDLRREPSAASHRTNSRLSSGLKITQVPEHTELVGEFYGLNYSKANRKKSRFVRLHRD